MRIRKQQLHNLPVVTERGQPLGTVSDYIVDVDEQRIVEYIIRPQRTIAHIVTRELVVRSSQVISITPERMVVDDAVQKNDTAEEGVAAGIVASIG